MGDGSRRYETVVSVVGGRVMVFVPFDPDAVSGFKPQHHVAGTGNGRGVRAEIDPLGRRGGDRARCGVAPGLRRRPG